MKTGVMMSECGEAHGTQVAENPPIIFIFVWENLFKKSRLWLKDIYHISSHVYSHFADQVVGFLQSSITYPAREQQAVIIQK